MTRRAASSGSLKTSGTRQGFRSLILLGPARNGPMDTPSVLTARSWYSVRYRVTKLRCYPQRCKWRPRRKIAAELGVPVTTIVEACR
jgi:hypothetical protein